jgi:hypothetical protein
MIALGFDPGEKTGAGALLDLSQRPARFVAGMAWRTRDLRRGTVADVWSSIHGENEAFASVRLWISELCRISPDVVCAVEGVRFQGMGQGDPVPRAAHAARVAGWVEAYTSRDAARPYAQAWRKRVFGLSNKLKAPEADAAILRLLPALVTLPAGIPPWALKHLPDACGVALSLRTP